MLFSIMLSIVAISLAFSYVLGKYYLHNVVKGYPVSKTVYRKVYYQVAIKKIRLQPLSVYTLQTGVFTDTNGAKQFANSLKMKGLRPFISPQPPYKVFVFAAPTREKIEVLKKHTSEEAFIVNDILNNVEVEVRADEQFWLEFLPKFAQLFSETLNILSENSSTNDVTTAIKWRRMAQELRKEKKNNAQKLPVDELALDFETLAEHLSAERLTIQDKGSCGQALLKTKYDYDKIRQFFAKY